MRFRPAFSCFALIAALCVPGAFAQTVAPLETPQPATIVPLLRDGNHLTVSLLVNGKYARLAIDTGASACVLTPAKAAQLNIRTNESEKADVNGSEKIKMLVAQAKSVQVGTVNVDDVDVAISPVTEGMGIDGVLGMSFLRKMIVTLDYTNRRMTLDTSDKPVDLPGATIVPIEWDEYDCPIVSGSVFGLKGRFDIDTGSDKNLILHPPFVRKNKLESRFSKRIAMPTGYNVGGLAHGEYVRLPLLTIGEQFNRVDVSDILTVLSDDKKNGFTHDTLAGNIGAGIWSRFTVTFDFKRSKMYLQKNADFDKPLTFSRTGFFVSNASDDEVIALVLPNSPASEAGLAIGDRILSVNGIAVKSDNKIPVGNALRRSPVGTTLKLIYRRKNETVDRTVTIITRDLL